MSELALLDVERIVGATAAVLTAIASSPEATANGASCQQYVARLTSHMPQISMIQVLQDGDTVCTSGGNEIGELAHQAGSGNTPAQRAAIVGHYVSTAAGPGLLLQANAPFEERQDVTVLGVISASHIGEVVRERAVAARSEVTIADRRGTIIAREPFRADFVGRSIPSAYMPLVTAPLSGSVEIDGQDGYPLILGYQPATSSLGLYVSTGVSTQDAFAPIDQAFGRGMAVALGGGALAFLLAWAFGIAFIHRPLGRLLGTITQWRSGDYSARASMPPGAAEFHGLGNAVDQMLDEIDERRESQRKAEEHRDLLQKEMAHRVKNLLAAVQAVARQTFQSDMPEADKLNVLSGRLKAMGEANALLVEGRGDTCEVEVAVRTAVAPFDPEGHEERFQISGPELVLNSRATLALAMALHELCTNAAKYGALSKKSGRIEITWQAPDEGTFRFTWRELNGPPVSRPSSAGFGSKLIRRTLAADMGASVTFTYDPAGFVCDVAASADVSLILPSHRG